MGRRLAAVLIGPALLAGCASPETRLRTGLQRAGLPAPLASCMADRMVHRLSLIQLRRLAALPEAPGAASLDQALHRLRSLRDPEIVGVATSSAALCATGLAG